MVAPFFQLLLENYHEPMVPSHISIQVEFLLNSFRNTFLFLFLFQVQSFNDEEEAFGWEVTAYPQRQHLMSTLTPFHKLYETTVEFQNKYKYVSNVVLSLQIIFFCL